ncbi:MAG: thioredoxin [Elusimicrobia bacterium]|nr:thioredoxin [Candidatus Liberimonas magnetica]
MADMVINEQNFDAEVLNSQVPVLVDFWAPWCGPCKMIGPVVEEIAKEYAGKLKVGKINTDENLGVASKYQITSIPCLLFFKAGKVVERIVGFRSKNDLKKIVDKVIA